MTNELFFKTNSTFNTVTFDKDTFTWNFCFADKIYASSTGFWRLLKDNKIKLVSLDNGHQFGRTDPINLVEEVTKLLINKKLIEIKVDKNTADLTLIISDDIKIEIFIASSGYETYDFMVYDKRYIGLGSGDIAIYDN